MQKPNKTLKTLNISKSWTLFLDRDGVINVHIEGYINDIRDFHFIEGSLEAIKNLSSVFGRIVVVTNQQGIGKKLMTEDNLNQVHGYMLDLIRQHGGNIDKIYFAPQLESEKSIFRKPNTGMAIQAKQDFPEIDFSKSVVIGDKLGDMRFGKNFGAHTVYVGKQLAEYDDNLIDFTFSSLFDFSAELISAS